MMIHDLNPIARAIAAGAILSVFVLANPWQAAAQTSAVPPAANPTVPVMQAAPQQAAPMQAAPMRKASHAKMSPTNRVETRIKDLHNRLQITAAQEPQWNSVAQAMRDNAKSMETVIGDRTQKIKTMTAVDDLRSYESLAETHADGLKKLVSAFGPLYDSMSASQKKTADTLFRHHERHMSATKKS
jgi:periplasmic protein CpxP/Spy